MEASDRFNKEKLMIEKQSRLSEIQLQQKKLNERKNIATHKKAIPNYI